MNRSALNHDCAAGGCAKVVLDPKLHAFDDCFHGKIRMGDIDGAVERRGYVLFLEWKRGGSAENLAQVLLHKAITSNSPNHLSVFVVGDAETMAVERIRVMANGNWRGEWERCSLDDLRRRFSGWFSWADQGGFRSNMKKGTAA